MRKILTYPNKYLTTPAKPVPYITDDVIELLEEMHRLMTKYDGVGLAANQVGELKQIVLVEGDEGELYEMINPKIISKKGKTIDVEGCLSFPDVYGTVERADQLVVRFVDREGYEIEMEADGYLSRIIQHEIDHLYGEVFTDKIIESIAPEDLERYMEENAHD